MPQDFEKKAQTVTQAISVILLSALVAVGGTWVVQERDSFRENLQSLASYVSLAPIDSKAQPVVMPNFQASPFTQFDAMKPINYAEIERINRANISGMQRQMSNSTSYSVPVYRPAR